MKTIATLISGCLCLAWACAAADSKPADTWTDSSPHKVAFVPVNGVKLQYLDWGGRGEAILFLAGLGDGGHIFDDLAPEFTNRFHVLALTRRGSGKSDKPAAGYELDTLAEDIRQFLDALKIQRVNLVGHSFGGVETTRFTEKFPDRVIRVVYLEGCYDCTAPGTEILGRVSSLEASPTPQDRAAFATLLKWFQNNRPGWNNACESNFRDTRLGTAEGYTSKSSMPNAVDAQLEKLAFTFKPDFPKNMPPALAFFADHRLEKLLQNGGLDREKHQELLDAVRKWQRGQIEQFTRLTKNGRVFELPDTDHYCFIQRQKEVVREMQSFLK